MSSCLLFNNFYYWQDEGILLLILLFPSSELILCCLFLVSCRRRRSYLRLLLLLCLLRCRVVVDSFRFLLFFFVVACRVSCGGTFWTSWWTAAAKRMHPFEKCGRCRTGNTHTKHTIQKKNEKWQCFTGLSLPVPGTVVPGTDATVLDQRGSRPFRTGSIAYFRGRGGGARGACTTLACDIETEKCAYNECTTLYVTHAVRGYVEYHVYCLNVLISILHNN